MRRVSAAETAAPTWFWAVHAEGLQVRAGRHLAVDGLDLALGTGVHALLGPNGAGKTTLMRALATVSRPSGGQLTLLGQSLDGDDLRQVRRRLGYLPQQFGFYPRFTVREFVGYMAWLKEVPKDEVPDGVQRAIDRVGLTARADAPLKTLSGGMLRRVGVAQAIVNDPDLLLLDEPTVGLDPEQRLDFRELLRDLGTDSCVLVSTHLVEDVVAACSDVLLVHEGRLVHRGTTDSLAAHGGPDDAGETAPGDTAAERGYSALLRRHRAGALR
jgi:ABC-type multidrug transport system ATPase subunit